MILTENLGPAKFTDNGIGDFISVDNTQSNGVKEIILMDSYKEQSDECGNTDDESEDNFENQ